MNQQNGHKDDKDTVAKSQDPKTDQDFPGFPHAPSQENLIKPKTEDQKKTAALDVKDGEKKNKDEQNSDGSGGAFEATESINDDE
jgi:hypothetical protein